VPIWPASRVVGLRAPGSARLDEPIEVEGVVLDLDGQPLRFASVEIDVYERRSYAARKRMVGGYYAYENVEEVRRIGPFCWNRSDRSGRNRCSAPPPRAGELLLVARSSDWSGRVATTNVSVYVAGAGDDWFAQGEGDRMDVVPEKSRYEPGDTARFQVACRFAEATALVSVERGRRRPS
jgi:hypothetical protein